MGLFDFLKSDKKKAHDAAAKAKEQIEQQAPAARPADAAPATRGAAERMAAAAPPKPAHAAPAKPTPASAAHKAVPATPKPAAMPKPGEPASAAPGAAHTPTPASAAHKAVPAAPKPAATAKRRTYTVRPGDSLSAIARRELGNEGRWRELYAINQGVIGSHPDLIRPGMVLTLP
ncbi:LysM peptidoglycan-binding domain-containing protein [Streptomyces sp. ISL-94]|uniref:LysM peptidoglycan-binding domain-containing protein n=1 Tax=Streptomyces sp. ISL-94 TaxID=2819190 RepID=UPI001BE96451|nr:LysM domain-containing protein [Streptomyces sp. ISL-94]MBT2478738.1 LysM peptidoglycan-binding domain-containing protein [Streptomyces sp. ISL-94]